MFNITMKTNIKGVAGRIAKLPEKFEKATNDIILEASKQAVKIAKNHAPRATGTLREGIEYRKISDKTYEIGVYGAASRYAGYVERGFTSHYIPIQYIELHYSNPGVQGSSEAMSSMGYSNPLAYAFVSGRAQPFMKPALTQVKENIPEIARKIVLKRISKRS